MLKKLLYFFLFYVMFVFSANSQQITYTPQTANGYQFKYLKVDSLFHLSVGDTSLKKGVARAGAIVFRNADSLYYGYNGVRWVLLGGTGKVYADYGLINVNDSTLKADSLQLTTLAKSYKIVDSLDKLYLKLTGGIVTGTVDIQQPLSLGEGEISRGRLNFFNEDNGNTGSLSSIPYTSNREWLLPDYDGTLTTEDSLRSKTDSLLNIINGRATFGDVRDIVEDTADVLRAKILADSSTLASSINSKVNISDTSNMLQPYRDTLASHNSRILNNVNNVNLKLNISDSTIYSTKANGTKQRDSLQANINLKVSKSGDVITGRLTTQSLILNKDSIQISTTNQWILAIDTVTGNITRINRIAAFVPNSDTTITTNYTLTQRDLGRTIYCTNTSLITITIPTGLTTGITLFQDRRYNIGIYQEGTGNGLVQFTGSGVTIQSTEGAVKTRVTNSYVEIKFKSDTVIKLVGDII